MNHVALLAYVKGAQRVRELKAVDRERGLTTTEIAVMTFVLVAIAVAIGAVLYNYANGQVENLDDLNVDEARITGGGE